MIVSYILWYILATEVMNIINNGHWRSVIMKPNNYYNRPVFVKILTLPGLRGVSHVNINSESIVFTITSCQQSLHFSTHL